jgi:hypothetical protein
VSETAAKLFESLKGVKEAVQAVAPGLKSLVPELQAEISRFGTQGAMELASALFSGNAFVPYGPGQYTPSPAHEQGGHERGIER